MQPVKHLKVSIIVINDNNPTGLQKTLSSILAQTYSNLECLVGNNDSSEASAEVIKKNSHIIFYSLSAKQRHKSKLVDIILPHSRGEFIMVINSGSFFCADDVIEQLLNTSLDKDLIYGDAVRIYSNGPKKGETLAYPNDFSFENVVYNLPDVLAVSLIRREILDEIKLYDEELFFAVEWAFILKVFLTESARVQHKQIPVANIVVGRHGGTDKISNIQLIAKEKKAILEKCVPQTLASKVIGEQKDLSSHQGRLIQRNLVPFVEKIKYYYRSIRSKFEIIQYKENFSKFCYEIPIIINNRNQFTYLQKLITSLEKRGYKNLYIIDNDSDYPPLLEFYKSIPYKVFFLGENVGFCALWDTEVFDCFQNQYYVYTDSDLEIVEECPDDFMVILHYLLNKYSLGKVGLSLLTDDLPSHFENSEQVKKWEARFQKERIEGLAYKAMVDTTFALYRPNSFGDAGMLDAFRTSFPYSARHLPWYENTTSLNEEQKYYYQNAKTSSHWTSLVKTDK